MQKSQKPVLSLAAGLGSALFLCSSAISQDYIRNGSFETNAFVQNAATVPDSDLNGATSLADWIAGGASQDVRPDLYRQGSYYNAAGDASPLDRYFVGLYGPHGDFLEQTFSTKVGTSYLVSFQQSHGAVFDASVNGWTYNSSSGGILVHLSGSNILFDQTFTPSGPVVPANAVGPIPNGVAGLWEQRSFSFTADSDSTTIRFTGTGDGTQFLDDVNLSALPSTNPPTIHISSFVPTSGPIGTSVTITGTNFSATAADDIVYFGAVRAVLTAASTTALTVNVPLGATYAAPCVTVGGLTACANAPFVVTFPSSGIIDATSLSPRLDLPGGDGPMQVVIADLDGDGKPDLAMVSRYDSILSFYRNISASGSLTPASWSSKVDFPTTLDPVHLVAADVDGDGKLDLVLVNHTSGVVAGATDTVSIFLNTSTRGSLNSNSFAAKIDYPVGLVPQHVAVGDLDGDGRPDLAVANFNSGTVSILQNRSTPGHVDFAAKVDFTAAIGLHTVEIADLDGDGKLDLVAGNHENDTTSIWRNTSTPGTIGPDSFAPKVDFAGSGKTIAIGDLDGDGKPDLVAGSWRLGRLSIFRNTSTAGAIDASSFAPRVEFSADGYAHTVVITDLDGDGRPDLALVTEMPSHLSLFQNLSSPGSLTAASFGPRIDFGSGWNAVGVAIGDLDGDGKPDLVFANHYDDSITIYRNVIPLTAPPSRTLALAFPPPGQEGTTIFVPLELISEGDVGGMTFVLRYDPNYLGSAELSWSPLLEGLFNTVNEATPGEIHATFAFSGDAVPPGTQLLATVNFLLRSVPADLDTGLNLELLDVSSPVGDPITVGNLTRNVSAHITKRLILADNNANQRLDVGDATVILRFLTHLDTARPWDITGNDLNSNQNLDTGDAIKVLRAAAGVDPQPSGTAASASVRAASPKSSSLATELMVLSPVTQRGQALDLITFQVQLQGVLTALSGASLTVDYPTNALRLLNSQSYRFGGLVPAGSLAVWNVSPAQNNFAIQDGHLSLAVSSANAWPASNGVLAELTFQVQSGGTNRYAWLLVLRGGEISQDGFRNRFLLSSGGVFIGRDPLPGVLAVLGRPLSHRFQFSLTGEAGASYAVEVSTNLVNWAPMTNILNNPGLPAIVDGDMMNLPHRFYRTRPVD